MTTELAKTEVRAAVREDLAIVVQLLDQLAPNWHDDQTKPHIDEKHLQVWSVMLNEPSSLILVAERSGRPVGTLDLAILPALTDNASPIAVV
jgi:hypothetical protein